MKRALLLAAALIAIPATAQAIPPGGASADTPGTSATVTSRSVTAGATLGYRVTGFPAGQVVSIKIDDGIFCPEAGTHGACVVQQQRIAANGSATGSVQLPSDLKTGAHWLRFLASAPKFVNGKEVGTIGYTARGRSDFTVVAPSSGTTKAGSTAAATPTTDAVSGSGSGADAGTGSTSGSTSGPVAGATLSASPVAAANTSAATPSVSPEADDSATTEVAAAPAAETDARFPLVGTVGLVVLLLLAGALWFRARRTRA